jgi:hypothetical protein
MGHICRRPSGSIILSSKDTREGIKEAGSEPNQVNGKKWLVRQATWYLWIMQRRQLSTAATEKASSALSVPERDRLDRTCIRGRCWSGRRNCPRLENMAQRVSEWSPEFLPPKVIVWPLSFTVDVSTNRRFGEFSSSMLRIKTRTHN